MDKKRLYIINCSSILGLMILLIWLVFTPPKLTHAASYTVCTTGPPACDYSSIQSAVDKAGDGDVIKVAAGTYTGINTIGGKPQVVYIDKSITIRGGYTTTNWTTPDPVANPTTLDAQGKGRVFFITGDKNITVEGLHITGGNANGLGGAAGNDAGGGVYAQSVTVTFKDNRIFSNTANSSQTGTGGGLYFTESSVILEGNTISDNFGNGVFIFSYEAKLVNNIIKSNNRGLFLWEIDNAMIIGNTISDNVNNGHCGALQTFGDNVTIINNLITRNSSDWFGGLCVDGNNAKIIGNTISFNTAQYEGGGGTIGRDVEFIGNSVISNTASGGGGLLSSGETGVQIITGNIFSGNYAAVEGGGLLLGGNPVLTNNIIVDNSTDGHGSAIVSNGGALYHNTIVRNSGGEGSGLFFGGNPVTLTNNIIADHAVGIYVDFDASASLGTTLWGSGVWANDTDWAGDGTISTTNDLWGNPDFVDPTAGDYHIGSNSDAIDQGVDVGVMTDIDFHPRPYQAPDIGADEYWPPGVLKFINLPIIIR